MKKGFILYTDNYEPIKNLTLTEKGELLDAIFSYNLSGEIIDLSPVPKMAFQFLKPTFDRDIEKYNNICERNHENGLKGGRPKKPKETEITHWVNQEPKKAHIDIDKDIDKDKDKDFPPSLEDVKNYCKERNNNINPQSFIDFYSSKGWFVGKNKMKDWRACVRTWESRETKEKPKERSVSHLIQYELDKMKGEQ
jgi:hypothetical protein